MIFLSRECIYVPKCNGNRKLKAEEQVKFSVRAMTGVDEEKLTTLFSYSDDEKKIVIEPKVIDTFCNQVTKVWGVSDGTKDIETAREFVRLPNVYDYITETVAFIKKGLPEEDLKN